VLRIRQFGEFKQQTPGEGGDNKQAKQICLFNFSFIWIPKKERVKPNAEAKHNRTTRKSLFSFPDPSPRSGFG